MSRLSPWMVYVARSLEGGPRLFDDLVNEAALRVPPGRAMRRFNRDRSVGVRGNPTVEEQIFSGARWVVLESMRMASQRNRISVFSTDMGEMVALSEGGWKSYFNEDRMFEPPPSWSRSHRYKNDRQSE